MKFQQRDPKTSELIIALFLGIGAVVATLIMMVFVITNRYVDVFSSLSSVLLTLIFMGYHFVIYHKRS